MTLFSSIQLAKNSLLINQIGMQVTGNNIANAATPGYVRQEVDLAQAPPQQYGDVLLGQGARIESISQKIDYFLEERLRSSGGDLKKGEAEERAYLQLEAMLGELTDADLSTEMTEFFATLHEVLNQPEDLSIRRVAVLQGEKLTTGIRRINSDLIRLRKELNERVVMIADEVNQLTEAIAKLNVQIVTHESGGARNSDAVGLRDERQARLRRLAEIMDIRSIEQPSGAVTVTLGGSFLVADSEFRQVTTTTSLDREVAITEIRLEDPDAPLDLTSGELQGLITARDGIVGDFLDRLDAFTQSFIFEFNRVHSSGQGLSGFDALLSEHAVSDPEAALDVAGLPHTPTNGSFELQLFDTQTGLTETTVIEVDLDGLDSDTTLSDLTAQLDAIEGLSARITVDRRLELSSDSPQVQFGFASDSSGVLAALGVNSFFSGSSSMDIGVDEVIRSDPLMFAGSRGGVGEDVQNAAALAELYNTPLESLSNRSLFQEFERFLGETIQNAGAARSVAEGYRVFNQALQSEKMGLSGVSIDEEAIRMLSYQRTFQASARYIQTISEMLEILVGL